MDTKVETPLAERAYRIRRYALRMGEVQGQGYIGQALGYADVLAVAYGHALNVRPDDPQWEGRDRFLLSHGHYAIAFYAALIEAGIIPETELETYGCDDSRLPMSGMAQLHARHGNVRRLARPGSCRSRSAWRWRCGRRTTRRSSTTRCPMANSTKALPGRRRWPPRTTACRT